MWSGNEITTGARNVEGDVRMNQLRETRSKTSYKIIVEQLVDILGSLSIIPLTSIQFDVLVNASLASPTPTHHRRT
jgi:hypothetical protein